MQLPPPQPPKGQPSKSGLQRNPALICAFHALQMSLFPMAIITIFYRQEIGMSMRDILLLQGCFGLAMAAFEFPSGYLADRIGYRKTLIGASLVMVVGWLVYCRADSFATVLAAEALLGVANSLISGCDSALLYESLVETDREADFAKWNGRMRFCGQSGEGSAALVAGLLYAHDVRLPFLVEASIWIANAALAWRLVEPARHRPPLDQNWQQIRSMLKELFLHNPKLRAVVGTTIALGMASFVPVWTIQLYAKDSGVPTESLGLIWASANFTVAIMSLASRPLAQRIGLSGLVLVCLALTVFGYSGMVLTHAIYGFAFYFALTAARGLFGPVLSHEEHRLLPSSDRAGFLSLRSLIFRTLFLCLALPVGSAMDIHGQRPVLAIVGALITISILTGWNAMRRQGCFVRT